MVGGGKMMQARRRWLPYYIGGAIAVFAAIFAIATQLKQHGGSFLLTGALAEMFCLYLLRRYVFASSRAESATTSSPRPKTFQTGSIP
jgi:hypothetical protein